MSTTTTTTNPTGPGGVKLRLSCDSCKGAKIRCGQERPACKRCREHGITCQYSPSRRMGRPRNRPPKEPEAKSSPGENAASTQQEALPQLLPSVPNGTPSTVASEFTATTASPWPAWSTLESSTFTPATAFTPGTNFTPGHDQCFEMAYDPMQLLNDFNPDHPMETDLAFDDSFLAQWTVSPEALELPANGDANMMSLDAMPSAGQNARMSIDSAIQREGAPALVHLTSAEKKSLLQAINEPQTAGCRLGPVLASCEKLTMQLSTMSDLDKCATRLSTALAECHTIRVVAQSLANGLTRCCEDRSSAAAGIAKTDGGNEAEGRRRSSSPTQMLRFGTYQVQVTRENELVRALVRRRFDILQRRLEEISDGNRPRSLREEIRRCVLAELRSDLGGMLAEV